MRSHKASIKLFHISTQFHKFPSSSDGPSHHQRQCLPYHLHPDMFLFICYSFILKTYHLLNCSKSYATWYYPFSKQTVSSGIAKIVGTSDPCVLGILSNFTTASWILPFPSILSSSNPSNFLSWPPPQKDLITPTLVPPMCKKKEKSETPDQFIASWGYCWVQDVYFLFFFQFVDLKKLNKQTGLHLDKHF